MFQTKSIVQEKIENNSYLFTNLVFAFFPISFILGSFIVSVNLLLICCLGIYHLRSKVLTTKFDFSIKIIFLFFLIIFFSTSLSFLKTLYFEGYDSINVVPYCFSTNCFTPLVKLTKSILFLRFLLFLTIVYLLSKFNILDFKFFFLTAAFSPILISLDIIYQYFFGFNLIGLKSFGFYNTGFFGTEFIAGGYIQRFAFFAVLLTVLVFKNKNYTKYIFPVVVICILCAGMLFSGNRMSLISFIFGLCLLLLFNLKIKKILFVSFVALFILLKFITFFNESYKIYLNDVYSSFFGRAINIIYKPLSNLGVDVDYEKIRSKKESVEVDKSLRSKTQFYKYSAESYQKRIFLTAIDTWRANKIFGNGIKSFREDCWKLIGTNVNLMEDELPDKKNRLCSNHPHNYYFEILTETGIVGLFVISIIALLFIVFIFKNFKSLKQISFGNLILLSSIISLILETQPLKSTGSLFTTNNATYLILISSIVLSHKTLLKIKNFQ